MADPEGASGVRQHCHDSESTLVVHHRRYLPGREPWDYPDEFLITLCESCHEEESSSRSDNESDLLEMLKELFLSEDIHYLASGFHLMELQHSHEVVAAALEWALSSPEIQRELVERWFAMLKTKQKGNNA